MTSDEIRHKRNRYYNLLNQVRRTSSYLSGSVDNLNNAINNTKYLVVDNNQIGKNKLTENRDRLVQHIKALNNIVIPNINNEINSLNIALTNEINRENAERAAAEAAAKAEQE